MMAEPKDWATLLSPCGNARQYFKDATGGAPWVDKMCDQLVEVITAKQLPQGITDGELTLIKKLTSNPLTRKVHIHRNDQMRWEVAVDFMDVGSWTTAVGPNIESALSALYEQEHKLRLKYGMKQLGEHHAG